jgi:predicted Zn-dependent peptidase
MNFLLEIENSSNRLEELARNFSTHGNLTIGQYAAQIDAVTSDQINMAARRALNGKPTIVVTGGAINLVPTITDVQRQLN